MCSAGRHENSDRGFDHRSEHVHMSASLCFGCHVGLAMGLTSIQEVLSNIPNEFILSETILNQNRSENLTHDS
jgi:hypothetical protein